MAEEYDWQTEWVQEDAEETLKEDYETHLDNRRAKPGFDGHHRINCRVCQPPKERNPEAKFYLRIKYGKTDLMRPRHPDVDSEGQINPALYFMSAAAYNSKYKASRPPANAEGSQTVSAAESLENTANKDGGDVEIAPDEPPKQGKFDQQKPKSPFSILFRTQDRPQMVEGILASSALGSQNSVAGTGRDTTTSAEHRPDPQEASERDERD